jgi:Reverse transcriptase (RNA-dependent DNA polymerase).
MRLTIIWCILCHLQKVFDYVNHNILLTELEFYGITGIAYKLIKSYLEGRYRRMVLNNISDNSFSNWAEIKHGVPQRSLLGPPLF